MPEALEVREVTGGGVKLKSTDKADTYSDVRDWCGVLADLASRPQ